MEGSRIYGRKKNREIDIYKNTMYFSNVIKIRTNVKIKKHL